MMSNLWDIGISSVAWFYWWRMMVSFYDTPAAVDVWIVTLLVALFLVGAIILLWLFGVFDKD